MIQWLSVWYCTFCFLMWNARCSASDGKRNLHFNAMVLLVRPWVSWSPIYGAVEEPFKLYTYDLNDLALEDLCGFFLLDALSCSKATELVPSSAFFFWNFNDSTWSYHELSLSLKGHQLVEALKRTQQCPLAISRDTCRLNRYHLQQRCKEMGWVDPNISYQGHQTWQLDSFTIVVGTCWNMLERYILAALNMLQEHCQMAASKETTWPQLARRILWIRGKCYAATFSSLFWGPGSIRLETGSAEEGQVQVTLDSWIVLRLAIISLCFGRGAGAAQSDIRALLLVLLTFSDNTCPWGHERERTKAERWSDDFQILGGW